MSDRYFELINVVEVETAALLQNDRARALATAIATNRDFKLLKCYRSATGPGVEYLVVDIECHEVPGRNRHGILCPERAALVVTPDTTRLIEVHMLRKDFPLLMHQNQATEHSPASLCLYFEPPASVFRTWTPQRFLQRILWWLEKSAKDELHPADQPVEGLFFSSPYELILPWNYDELRAKNASFLAVRGPDRPGNQGVTCFIEAAQSNSSPRLPPITHISLELPAIVHGSVEQDPSTLGELADILQRRGVNLLSPLQDAIRAQVDSTGLAKDKDSRMTVVLLNVPIRRNAGEAPSGWQRRAFVAVSGGGKLGEATGALMLHEGKYFSAAGLIGAEPGTRWREEKILPMAVLRFGDTEMARFQSGILEPGPKALLIGAGSLGSALLNLWGRSGWGQWSVVDKDHVKPHNLVRHVAYAPHVGRPKSFVVAELHDAMSNGASEVRGIYADACYFNSPPMADALNEAQLVVDISTTLEYPRGISGKDGAPRHISAFITPTGNSAVLLAEDARRESRLRTLEAQYYRAIIESDWGKDHLEGARTFWSGASCRDISYVLPYARIQAHASLLAEQIPLAWKDEAPRACVWSRNPESSEVVRHVVQVHPERSFPFGKLKLYMDFGVENLLRELRQKALPHETGGTLLGYYDFNIGAVVVVTALPAPPDSRGTRGSFERGVEGLRERVAEIGRLTAGIVGYLGEWHSHPRGHSARPSGDDVVQLLHLAKQMSDEGLPAVQIIVGEKDISVLQGEMGALH